MKKTLLLFLLALTASPSLAQNRSLPQLDATFSISSLGLGVQASRPLTSRSDVRGGFNFYRYTHGFSKDGATYAGKLTLNSIDAQFDQYLAGPLHVSGGALIWNGNKAEGTVSVPAGQSFTLGGTTYISEASAPVHGAARVDFRKAAPKVLIGLGNLPKKGHIAYSVEAGAVFQGSPRTALTMAGHACASGGGSTLVPIGGLFCADIATTPAIQADVAAEQRKINDDLKPFKYYPVLQFTIGYKFK